MSNQESPRKVPDVASQDADPRLSTVYDLLEKAVEDHVFPGCAFGVSSHGRTVATGSVGRQRYEASSKAILPETAYDLASLTKVVATTAMAMLMHQRGQFDLDMPVVQVLSGFREAEDPFDRTLVTVRNLLAHNSGLPAYRRLFETHPTADSLFEACLHMPLDASPGAIAEYSDIGFILLGRLLETVAGEKLAAYCRREIFAPLEMTATRFRPESADRTSIPPTEDDQTFRHRVIQGEVQDENCFVLGGASGHAGLFGNVPDLLRFAHAVSSATSIFEAGTVETFSARATMPRGSSRALGWDTPSTPSSSGTVFSPQSIGHLGYAGTSLWIDLREQCAVVLLTNRTWPSRENQKIKGFRPVFHDAVRAALLLGERT